MIWKTRQQNFAVLTGRSPVLPAVRTGEREKGGKGREKGGREETREGERTDE